MDARMQRSQGKNVARQQRESKKKDFNERWQQHQGKLSQLMPAVLLLRLYKESCCITKLMPRHGRERLEKEQVQRARELGLQIPDYSLLWSGNPEREGLRT